MQNERTGTETVLEYPSANGTDTVVGFFYTDTAVQPKAIVQISHGMVEYIRRYADFAYFLASHGYVVCGNDHLGHGFTSGDTGRDGYFAEKDGADFVLADLHTMSEKAREAYPGLPLFLFGHSMGSFFARWYAEKYGAELKGLIISGTSGPNPLGGFGMALTSFLTTIKGTMYHSAAIEKMAVGSYCKKIPDAVTGKEWVTRDKDALAKYVADPKCSFTFTVSAYHEMMRVLQAVSRKQWATALPKSLPIFMVSGTDDPVGNYGKGVRTVYERLQNAGVQDVTMKLYQGCRHEVHNELPAQRAEMYQDVLTWLDAHQ